MGKPPESQLLCRSRTDGLRNKKKIYKYSEARSIKDNSTRKREKK